MNPKLVLYCIIISKKKKKIRLDDMGGLFAISQGMNMNMNMNLTGFDVTWDLL